MGLSIPFRILKSYVRFWTEKVYYENTFVQGLENVPPVGTPVLIVSNHQNSLNDALGILLAINDRKANFIVRADVFGISRSLKDFLLSIGLLPAYRLNYEGAEAMKANASTFNISERALMDGETVVMFPEGGHAEGHWFNMFKGGMAKMAFEAAEIAHFEKDIKIVPACNHYSSYYGLRNTMLVRFGEPVSLQPYYELYKSKPRTAMRQFTADIHDRIEAMVLDVKDKEFYEAIEYIRSSEFGDKFAKINGYEPDDFESRFESDKLLVSKLYDARKAEDKYFVTVKTEEGQSLKELVDLQVNEQASSRTSAGFLDLGTSEVESALSKAEQLVQAMKYNGVSEHQFQDKPEIVLSVLKAIALFILLPLAVAGLWPTAICWLIPKFFASRAKGVMFEGTFMIALNVLVIIPILSILTFVVCWLKFTALFALIYVLLFPLIFIFEWTYVQAAKQALSDLHWFKALKSGAVVEMKRLRENLFTALGKILTV